ncbi:MAG TPA: hypothetical protein VNK96_05885 [Fimbriimonadales bacterium]|nr:hypothetical protein [Fimbriimonadales bacterium]
MPIVIIAGLFTSDLTSLTIVRVSGADKNDEQRIRKILQSYKNIPALQIPTAEVESLIELNPKIKVSKFEVNVFGRAHLHIEKRKAIASIIGRPGMGADIEGKVFPVSKGSMPKIGIGEKVQDYNPFFSICNPNPYFEALQLAEKLQVHLPKLEGNLDLDFQSRLCFYVKGGKCRVLFGSGRRLDEKVEVLERALDSQPDLLESVRVVNLVEPDYPVVVEE